MVFAGFAGISSALSRRGLQDWTELELTRLRLMILFSIAAAGCSLLPIAVHGFDFSVEIAWASSSVLALLLHVALRAWSPEGWLVFAYGGALLLAGWAILAGTGALPLRGLRHNK